MGCSLSSVFSGPVGDSVSNISTPPPPLRLSGCRKLQSEYERLKKAHDRKGLSPLPSPPELLPASPQSARDAELIAEAKLLRQHKGRLEARMQILEDHNKQLESQLHRLRQLLEQVGGGGVGLGGVCHH